MPKVRIFCFFSFLKGGMYEKSVSRFVTIGFVANGI